MTAWRKAIVSALIVLSALLALFMVARLDKQGNGYYILPDRPPEESPCSNDPLAHCPCSEGKFCNLQ
jgi:hypothetical protein